MTDWLSTLREADRRLGEVAPGGELGLRLRASLASRARAGRPLDRLIALLRARRSVIALAFAFAMVVIVLARQRGEAGVAGTPSIADGDGDAHEAMPAPSVAPRPIAPAPAPQDPTRNGDDARPELRRSAPGPGPIDVRRPSEEHGDSTSSTFSPPKRRGSTPVVEAPMATESRTSSNQPTDIDTPGTGSLRSWPGGSIEEAWSRGGAQSRSYGAFRLPPGSVAEAPAQHDAPSADDGQAPPPSNAPQGCEQSVLDLGTCVAEEALKDQATGALCTEGRTLTSFDIDFTTCADGLAQTASYSCCPVAPVDPGPDKPPSGGDDDGPACQVLSLGVSECRSSSDLADMAGSKCAGGVVIETKLGGECTDDMSTTIWFTCCAIAEQIQDG